MYGNMDDVQIDTLGYMTYIGGGVDIEQLDAQWIALTYAGRRMLSYKDVDGFLTSISKLISTPGFEDLKFLFDMDDYDREQWVRRAHMQCHKEWLADPEAFPSCGLHESFKRIRALRKERAKLKKMNLG